MPREVQLPDRVVLAERASRSRRTGPADEQLAATTPVAQPAPLPPPPPPPPPPLAGCDGTRPDLSGYDNGRLPNGVLCEIPGTGERLRADAAVAFARMAAAFEADRGEPLCLTDGYRPIGEQQVLRRTKPRYAARPGFSDHGWGIAVDLSCGVQSSRTDAHAWVAAHAGDYGWYLPEWAQRGGSRPEPWHWEFDDGTGSPTG